MFKLANVTRELHSSMTAHPLTGSGSEFRIHSL